MLAVTAERFPPPTLLAARVDARIGGTTPMPNQSATRAGATLPQHTCIHLAHVNAKLLMSPMLPALCCFWDIPHR